jgi:Family of unknown function (DUF5686)/CarboxypepD_reg-like domain
MNHNNFKYLLLFWLIVQLFCFTGLFAQEKTKTVIKGTVIDEETKETLPYVTIVFTGKKQATISDNNGAFTLSTLDTFSSITVSYLGYITQNITVAVGQVTHLDIKLKTDIQALKEVVIKPRNARYKNRNNPAVELIDNVIRNRSKNRSESFNYLQYEKYDKNIFALSNISPDFKKKKIFDKFQFVFENTDTTEIDGKEILPVYIRESISDYYYKKPNDHKEIVKASKMISLEGYLDNKGISEYLKYFYQNIDIYSDNIMFVSNQFLSPIAGTAPVFYKYFILDTTVVNNIKCIHVAFVPRNKTDLLFQGTLFIMPDSSYAIRRIDMTINKAINLNWVKSVRIRQDFENTENRGYMLVKDELDLDFGITKNSLGIYGERTVSYKDFVIDKTLDDSLFTGQAIVTRNDADNKTDAYWKHQRHMPLQKSEQGIYTVVDSIKHIPAFKHAMTAMVLIFNSFFDTKYLEIGPYTTFASYNSVEGLRLRFGGRTSPTFSKKVELSSYLAYGFMDKQYKYDFETAYSLTDKTVHDFPVKLIKIKGQYDTKIPGEDIEGVPPDNIWLTFKRGVNDKMYYNQKILIENLNEFENHFSYTIGYQYIRETPAGNLIFNNTNYLSGINNPTHIEYSEPYFIFRYAPNEQFYQGKLYRTSISNGYPVFQLQANFGLRFLADDYFYQNLKFSVTKRFWFSVIGYTDIIYEAGKIFGKVSFPLLDIHRANQTYSYDVSSYNLMNFLEFLSDQYTSLNIDHCFNGFIFNKVPLFKRLKFREVASVKVLYGSLSSLNDPSKQPDLLKFPVNAQGKPTTFALTRGPYVEGSIGISNILKYFRVDLVHRFTYLSNPNVAPWGLRVKGKFDF